MNDFLKTALEYRKLKLSIIPVGQNKKPLIDWKEYQTKLPSRKQIKKWWKDHPHANVAIVTGKISNLTVIDCDSKEAKKHFKTICKDNNIDLKNMPTVKTPRGYHFYFTYDANILQGANRIGDKIDVRNEGGYVLAPPSINEKNACYVWINNKSIVFLYDELIKKNNALYTIHTSIDYEGANKHDFLIRSKDTKKAKNIRSKAFPEYLPVIDRIKNDSQRIKTVSGSVSNTVSNFKKGCRDETIFRKVNDFVRRGYSKDEIIENTLAFCRGCDPPFSEKEALPKIERALSKNLSPKKCLEMYLETCGSGYFCTKDFYFGSALRLVSNGNDLARVRLHRASKGKNPIVERHPSIEGKWRKLEIQLEAIDFSKVEPQKKLDLKWPLKIEEYVSVYPGDIILISGNKNGGKTTLLWEFIQKNIKFKKIHVLISETPDEVLLSNMNILKIDWKNDDIKLHRVKDNFAKAIKPGKNIINIIDYLRIHKDFFEISGILDDIHLRLNGAIAIIAIQAVKERPLGGERAYEKPSAIFHTKHINEDKHKLFCKHTKYPIDIQRRLDGKTLNYKIKDGLFASTTNFWIDPNNLGLSKRNNKKFKDYQDKY